MTTTLTEAPVAQPVYTAEDAAADIIAAKQAEGVAAERLATAALTVHHALAQTAKGTKVSVRDIASKSGESRSTVQRLDLVGQFLLKDGEIDVPEGETGIATLVRKAVIAAEGKVGIVGVRSLITAAADKAAALKALASAKPAADPETDEVDGETEADEDEADEVDVDEDDFSVNLGQVERALALALASKPLVPFTEDEAARVAAIVTAVQALAAQKG